MSLSTVETRIATAFLTEQEAEARLGRTRPNERMATLRHSVLSTFAHVITNTLFMGLTIAACALPGSSPRRSHSHQKHVRGRPIVHPPGRRR